jgi:DNA-binding NtrC family response regulator/Tfp pilus assembly protein PilF
MGARTPHSKQPIDEAIRAGQLALEESRFEEAATRFRSALRMTPRSAEEEAFIRCQLSDALEKRSLARDQLEVVAKYETPSEFARLSERTQMLVLIRLGWAYSFNNDIPRAIASFNRAMQIAERLEDHAGMGGCHFGLGRAYRNISEIRIAGDHYTSALKHYRQTGDWRRLAESYIAAGYLNAYEGDYRGAVSLLRQALTIIGDKGEHNLLGRAFMYLAITYDNLGSTSRAIASWERCLEHYTKAGDASNVAINQNNLADKLIWLGEWNRAEDLLKQAIDVLGRSANVAHYGGALDTLAQLYLLEGRLDEALHLLEESLKVLSTIRTGEWVEVSTRMTLGRCSLVKGSPDDAIVHLDRAIDMCIRAGERRQVYFALLSLAEAWLQKGDIERARTLVTEVRSALQESPNMLWWGYLMRMQARIQAAEGHLEAAIHSLGQSTSFFQLRGSPYGSAVNRAVLAQLFERQGRLQEAISEAEAALDTFQKLGAQVDHRDTAAYLESLLEANASLAATGPASPPSHSPELASVIDGFTVQRLVQARVSRDLLLHEMASIARQYAEALGALVVALERESVAAKKRIRLKVVTSVGLDGAMVSRELELIAALSAEDYHANYIFVFSDNNQSEYALRVVQPRSQRFLSRSVTLEPLLRVVEQGLEANLLKSKSRRGQVFDPTRLLSEAELPGFICASRAMKGVLEQLQKIRSSDVTVLITGESGTGKELIARALHAGSSRRQKTFLPFNCSAAARDMVESQLFGHRKGAFTGAVEPNPGIIRAAEGGTLFLDEIGDLPLDLQPKLLRFLQEGEILPIGENQPLKVDVRVLAATNSDLERAVAEGRFRQDLFHRLNVIRVQVPPLRQRREEIPALIDYYVKLYQQEAAKTDVQLSEEAVDLMVVYDWPGNVRELCNEVRRIVAYSDSGSVVGTEALSPEIVRAGREMQAVEAAARATSPATPSVRASTLAEAVEALERRMIQDALRSSGGNIARAAKQLGLSRKGLYIKMGRLKFEA